MTIRLTGALAVLLAAHVAGGTAVAQTGAARQPSNPTRPGQTFKECRNCPEMVVVPSGSFVMGSSADEPDRRESEVQVRVTFRRPFAIAKTEVTWPRDRLTIASQRSFAGPAVPGALSRARWAPPETSPLMLCSSSGTPT
jgi:hypothetical protein